MATSAKRLGLEVGGDLELELRLRRIELEIDKRALANQDATATSRARNVPPQVTGIRVVGSTPGAVTIAWNASTIADLRRYDVDFAEDISFTTNKQTFPERATQFQFSTASSTGGAGGTTFFARVRAVNSILQVGPYSVTLNTATGEVVSGDIADGAIDTVQLADSAVTNPKTDLANLSPTITAGDALRFVQVNSAATALVYTPGTLPALIGASNANQYLRANSGGTAIGYRAGTLPAVAAAGNVDDIAIVTAADIIGYFNQDVQNEAAASAGGGAGTNRQGTLVFPGGLKIQWDTVNVAAATTSTVTLPEAYDVDNFNVIVSYGEDPTSATAGDGVAGWVPADGGSHLTSVVLRNDFDVALDISYISVGQD